MQDDSDPDPDESVRFGIVAPRRLRDELDATKRRREEQRLESVSRSEVAREALLVGLAAMELIDDEPALRTMHPRERRSLVRQALQAELRSDD